MAPTRKHEESPDSQSEEAIAVSSGNTVSGSEKYVCPPWSYHCRPDNPAPIDTKSGLLDPSEKSTGPQLGNNSMVSKDGIAMPRESIASGSEKYVCPPWSYHCRPDHPAPINADSFPTTKTVDDLESNIHIGEGTGSTPGEEDLPISATTLIGHPSVVPSPASPEPHAGTTDAIEAIQIQSAGISKRGLGDTCILSKDPVTGVLVDECKLLDPGSISNLSKSNSDNDLLAHISKYRTKRIISDCFLYVDPSSQKLTLTCQPGEFMKLGASTQNSIFAISIPQRDSSWRLSGSQSSYRDWNIILPVIAIALLVYALVDHLLGRRKGSGDRSKQAKNHKKSKTAKQMYPVDAKHWPASSEVAGINALPTKPEHCVLG